MANFQRNGAKNNAAVGRDFENKIREYFLTRKKINLKKQLSIKLGVSNFKKEHRFDLGSKEEKILIECKSHKWTESSRTPVAKMTVWNEAMYYFLLAPKNYEKYFIVLRDYNEEKKMTLAQYYLFRYKHMIPEDVKIFEYDEDKNTLKKIF